MKENLITIKTDTIKVYRWEHKIYKCGPYHCHEVNLSQKKVKKYNLYRSHMLFYHCDSIHPTPDDYIESLSDVVVREQYEDAFLYKNTLFGFTTLDDMHTWFTPEEINIMICLGFVLKKYTVNINDYYPMKGQCMFIPNSKGVIIKL